ncbi:ctr copper transporter [Diplogelasinospora grovesii]|uniref:Copper transport protein n=1 Tax=Diplogelasinospora grovesii TaxID=303347 RepID=A0AAN6MX78_9PEZI|nr:ctr copper transporter [Diplogelasinospora grovesii]
MTGMDMGSSSASTCKISMMWNWYTIDACFLSEQWQITTSGEFAATCIGVMLMVVLLEAFRRLGKEYDERILREFYPFQQIIRAVIHAATFGLAYIIMLLAMYYNGYVIICIVIGAGLGKFLCDWMAKTVLIDANGLPVNADDI